MYAKQKVFLAVFAAIAIAAPPEVAGAQEQTQTDGPTILEVHCIEQTRYIYDGFVPYPAGTEKFCVAIMSDGTTRSWKTGPLVQI